MLQDLPADRAPGLRRSTPAARAACLLADGYRGLGAGVTRWRLAAALRGAARPLGLTAAMLRLLEHYIDLSYDEDWTPGGEPVITQPLVEIAEHLGRSERQIRNLERGLVERGLLAWRDSGNHHRKGRRDRRTGRLIWAYGPSLAPIGARAEEIIALADAGRAEIAEARRIRIAIGALRRRLAADLATAEAERLGAGDIATALAAVPARSPAGTPLTELRARRDGLKALAAALRERLDGLGREEARGETEIAREAEMDGRHSTDTPDLHAMNGEGRGREKPQGEPPATDPERNAGGEVDRDCGLSRIPLELALAAAGPEFARDMARRGRPSWRALVETASEMAPVLGIGPGLWGEACGRLGRNGAALAALILERALTRGPEDGTAAVARPAGWLRGVMARADQGRLRLDRSIRGLAQRPAARDPSWSRPPNGRSAGMGPVAWG